MTDKAPRWRRRLCAELAEYVGVSPSQVSRWEQPGGPVPRPGHRRRLAKLYGVEVSQAIDSRCRASQALTAARDRPMPWPWSNSGVDGQP